MADNTFSLLKEAVSELYRHGELLRAVHNHTRGHEQRLKRSITLVEAISNIDSTSTEFQAEVRAESTWRAAEAIGVEVTADAYGPVIESLTQRAQVLCQRFEEVKQQLAKHNESESARKTPTKGRKTRPKKR